MTDIKEIVLSSQTAPTAFFIRERSPYLAAESIIGQLVTAKQRGDDDLWDEALEKIRLYVSLRPTDAAEFRENLKATIGHTDALKEDRNVILNTCRRGDVDRREAFADLVRIDNLARDEERTRLAAHAQSVHVALLSQMEQFFDTPASAVEALKKR